MFVEVPQLSAEENKSLVWFVNHMAVKLAKNAHKGGWLNDDPMSLFDHLEEEVQELFFAIYTLKSRLGLIPRSGDGMPASAEDVDAVVEEAANLANMAMMVADVISRCGFDNAGKGETGR